MATDEKNVVPVSAAESKLTEQIQANEALMAANQRLAAARDFAIGAANAATAKREHLDQQLTRWRFLARELAGAVKDHGDCDGCASLLAEIRDAEGSLPKVVKLLADGLPSDADIADIRAELDALRAQPSPTGKDSKLPRAPESQAGDSGSRLPPSGGDSVGLPINTAKLDGETGPKCGHLMRDGETVIGLCEREPDHDGSHAVVRALNGPPEAAPRCHKCGKSAEVNDYEDGKGPPVCCDCCEPDAPAPAAEVEQAKASAGCLCIRYNGTSHEQGCPLAAEAERTRQLMLDAAYKHAEGALTGEVTTARYTPVTIARARSAGQLRVTPNGFGYIKDIEPDLLDVEQATGEAKAWNGEKETDVCGCGHRVWAHSKERRFRCNTCGCNALYDVHAPTGLGPEPSPPPPTPGGHGPTEGLRNELIAAARAVCARDNNAYGDLMGRFADELARQQGEKS